MLFTELSVANNLNAFWHGLGIYYTGILLFLKLKENKMAQLHVQKKRSQLWWLWILIVLIAIAVVYYLLVQNNTLPDTFGIRRDSVSVINSMKNYFIV